MDAGRILVVDDEAAVCRAYADILTLGGHEVSQAHSGADGLAAARQQTFDIVLLDKRLPDIDGLDVLRELQLLPVPPEIIVITAYASVEEGVTAIKAGAFDYLIKPIDMAELRHKVALALERRDLHRKVDALQEELASSRQNYGIVGDSPAIEQVLSLVRKIGGANCNVLITGETGTGKELVARAVHAAGDPAGNRPFVALNCAALPESIVERELFGHEPGAFTGAGQAKPGFFEAADGGTIFLDEITEVSLGIQAKLLRVIEEHEFFRLGSTTPTTVDVRLVTATNRPPKTCVEAGSFREDLLYRISVITIPVPPLRQRSQDIPLLVRHFVKALARKYEKRIDGLSPEALACLCRHDWPGNVRELQHAVEHAAALCQGPMIGLDALPEHLRREPDGGDTALGPLRELPYAEAKRVVVERFSCDMIKHHLRETQGNVSRAAQRLGLQRTALQRLMRRYAIQGDG